MARERLAELLPLSSEKEGIFKRVTDLRFENKFFKFDDFEIPLDKNSCLALVVLFNLLKTMCIEY